MSSSLPSLEPLFPEWAALTSDVLSILIDIDAGRHWGFQDPRVSNQLPDDILRQLDPNQVYHTLTHQLSTPLLDEIHNSLWLVARKESNHIDSLHYQVVKGRRIIPNEETKMHLVWTPDKIHIKPIPQYLFNHHFWKCFLCPRSKNADAWRAVAAGFLRSYAHLVRHRSDLSIAHEYKLIPEDVDWIAWTLFISNFRRIPDHQVAKRYLYGQMCLSRLSLLIRLQIPRERDSIWFYEPPHWFAGPYLRSFTTALGFLLASISLMLSSMQVSLNAGLRTNASTRTFSGFSTFTLIIISMVWLLLFVVPAAFLVWQFWFGLRYRNK